MKITVDFVAEQVSADPAVVFEITGDNRPFDAGSVHVTHFSIGRIPLAELVKGYMYDLERVKGIAAVKPVRGGNAIAPATASMEQNCSHASALRKNSRNRKITMAV